MKQLNPNLSAHSFLVLGYRDYIAARFLLNNNYILQGLTLSSTAVEKYIKSILCLNNKTKKEIGVHLNRLNILKKHLSDCYYDITQKMDNRFLGILDKIYQMRYYDDIENPITIGFFVNQFIGELDYTINLFETIVLKNIYDKKGNLIKTPYKGAVENKDKDLFKNNYLFNDISKKEHMEKEDNGFVVHVHPDSLAYGEIHVTSEKTRNEYDGLISEINLKFNNNK